MVSITCPCVECVHNGRANHCNAKKINFESQGNMLICDKYELSGFAKDVLAFLERVKEGGDGYG